MWHARLVPPVLVFGAVFVGGCLPADMPAYTGDGKTVVFKASGPGGPVLWTYDVQKKAATAHPSPGKGPLNYARMLGDQVWVEWQSGCERFDPARKEFVPVPEELRRTGWLRLAIPASHEGRKCLFLPPAGRPDDPNDKIQYSVYSFPELKKQEAVSLNQVIPAGGFWWVTLRLKNLPDDKREVEQVEVFNDEGRKVVSIEHEEGRKMAYTAGRFPGYARVAEDGRILLLAFQGSGYCTFGVFDTSSGKFLWGARTAGVTIRGNPVVRRTEVWALETQGSSLALVRYRPGGEGAGNEGRRDVIMKYPVNANVTADQFNPSPDGSHFVQAIDGKPSRLLFIPAREGVTDKDVVCVELRD